LGTTKLAREDYGVPALGYVVENAAFGAALSTQLKAARHCEFLAPARVTAATPVGGGMRVAVEGEGADTREVTAKLLVVAEGGRSPLCAQLGIARSQHDYGQHALIANVGLTQPHNGVAYERFTATGPLAMLPLIAADSAQRSSLVWTLDASVATRALRAHRRACHLSVEFAGGARAGEAASGIAG
jgi:2-polyprenyl-6-methoxyphenol hydroxylase-like FAD-dependent oxidoreductase